LWEFIQMPTLLSEPARYPDDLFDGVSVLDRVNRSWYVMHTRPHQEKCLARQLRQSCIPFYLPLICRHHRSRGRTLSSYLPLFPGYVFVFASKVERVASLATRRVVRSLDVQGQEKLWDDLRQIERLISLKAPITPEDRLTSGSEVIVQSGPLAGLRGVILRRATRQRFVVQVDFIQRGAAVHLDSLDLSTID
jgi:transcription antitermination factor NusG